MYLLTAGVPGQGMPAAQGKQNWAQRELSPQPVELVCVDAVDKQKFAVSPDGIPHVLIDDKAKTIDQWNAAGGFGILHLPTQSHLTIKKLKELGL